MSKFRAQRREVSCLQLHLWAKADSRFGVRSDFTACAPSSPRPPSAPRNVTQFAFASKAGRGNWAFHVILWLESGPTASQHWPCLLCASDMPECVCPNGLWVAWQRLEVLSEDPPPAGGTDRRLCLVTLPSLWLLSSPEILSSKYMPPLPLYPYLGKTPWAQRDVVWMPQLYLEQVTYLLCALFSLLDERG